MKKLLVLLLAVAMLLSCATAFAEWQPEAKLDEDLSAYKLCENFGDIKLTFAVGQGRELFDTAEPEAAQEVISCPVGNRSSRKIKPSCFLKQTALNETSHNATAVYAAYLFNEAVCYRLIVRDYRESFHSRL